MVEWKDPELTSSNRHSRKGNNENDLKTSRKGFPQLRYAEGSNNARGWMAEDHTPVQVAHTREEKHS